MLLPLLDVLNTQELFILFSHIHTHTHDIWVYIYIYVYIYTHTQDKSYLLKYKIWWVYLMYIAYYVYLPH